MRVKIRGRRDLELGRQLWAGEAVNGDAYFRTSVPASPNFRAANPTIGSAAITAIGVHMTQDVGAFACIITTVERKA